jgi:protein TonB
VYRVGGPVAAPLRLDVPKYPPDAVAAGITGAVLAEIVISESGNVTDAKVVRSIPLLDDAALQAVRNWHFEPTMVNGQGVPVRMVVTVNFTTR